MFCYYLYDCLNQHLPLTDLCPLFLFMYSTVNISLSMLPSATYQKYDVNIVYSRTCLNPYPSVDGPGYGLLRVMAFERWAKNRFESRSQTSWLKRMNIY